MEESSPYGLQADGSSGHGPMKGGGGEELGEKALLLYGRAYYPIRSRPEGSLELGAAVTDPAKYESGREALCKGLAEPASSMAGGAGPALQQSIRLEGWAPSG